MTRRIACLWLPRWSIQCYRQDKPEHKRTPLLFFEKLARVGEVVVQTSADLAREGIRTGMPLTDAKLRWSQPVQILEASPARDYHALRRLAIACQCFSPIVGIEETPPLDSLLFDLTGCIHLYGSEREFCRQLITFLNDRGLAGRIAIADTVGMAWGVAHYGVHRSNSFQIVDSQKSSPRLPVEALRLSDALSARLREFDLKEIDQILRLPRESLKPRFGEELPARLEQFQGHRTEVLVPEVLPEPVWTDEVLEYPITEKYLIEIVLKRVLQDLLAQLEKQQHGLLRLQVQLFNGKEPVLELTLGTIRPTLAEQELWNLIALKLETMQLRVEIDRVVLRAAETASLRFRRRTLFEDDSTIETREYETLINRLTTRLGDQAVLKAELVEDVQPERSVSFTPALEPPMAVRKNESLFSRPLRPLSLFSEPIAIRVNSVIPNGPPLRFWWDQQEHIAEITWGPERLETGWWRDDAIRRDYYRVETTTHQRFWLFRRREQRDWYLHGCFD
ncbi:Y-family DNA polymerase [Rubinisphaera margarita]|uniref:Y-family DNA polymerase n=1 Tax=Rubinisphaera margarita TaxID=2909586 RepID=UPI001EE9574A|nr:DNA polymerase Y family protein [Rubinisphaera margarita]MCG6156516.1 DNA polymerase Y family protein [Rubinisphaera margarita]